MKSHISKFPIFLVILICGTACTRNNGDIGEWFGTWQVMEITSDGFADTNYEGNVFWSFQNNIIRMQKINPNPYAQQVSVAFGTWKEIDNNAILLDMTHSDDSSVDRYSPFEETHLPYGLPIRLEIVSKSSSSLILSYTDLDNGIIYSYSLKKRG